jgi:hypothetical protein
VYGSVAKGSDQATSDIDLMVVSDTLSYGDVFGRSTGVAHAWSDGEPTVYSNAEFSKRTKTDNAFVNRVLEGPKVWVIGVGIQSLSARSLAGPGGVLGKEAPDAKEFDGLVRSGLARLRDAEKPENSLESRFDLAYSAAHALVSRPFGITGIERRSGIVFQLLPDTLGLTPGMARAVEMPRYAESDRVRRRARCGRQAGCRFGRRLSQSGRQDQATSADSGETEVVATRFKFRP